MCELVVWSIDLQIATENMKTFTNLGQKYPKCGLWFHPTHDNDRCLRVVDKVQTSAGLVLFTTREGEIDSPPQ